MLLENPRDHRADVTGRPARAARGKSLVDRFAHDVRKGDAALPQMPSLVLLDTSSGQHATH